MSIERRDAGTTPPQGATSKRRRRDDCDRGPARTLRGRIRCSTHDSKVTTAAVIAAPDDAVESREETKASAASLPELIELFDAFNLVFTYDEAAQTLDIRVLLGRGGPDGGPTEEVVSESDPCAAPVEEAAEHWVTKRGLAEHLGVTPRWIESRQRVGLPCLRLGGMNRYRVSEVEAWLGDHEGDAHGGVR